MQPHSPTKTSAMDGVPSDLTEAVLSNLPVKSLLRFRCVSKPWCSLIHDPRFILLHAKQLREDASNFSLIYHKNRTVCLSGLNSLGIPEKHEYPFMHSRRHAHLVKVRNRTGSLLVGSCNGLVCLFFTFHKLLMVVVWNISTRKYHIVNSGFALYTNIKTYFIGFGYDSIHDDYKLVRIVADHDDKCSVTRVVCEFYSLKTKTWGKSRTKILPYACRFNDHRVGNYCNEALHWIIPIARRVISFGLATEQWQDVPLPDSVEPVHLGSLKGCLYLITHHYENNLICNIDVWVMKVYGVKDSWTKSFSVSLETISQPLRFQCFWSYAIIGDKILIRDGYQNTVHLYDTKTKSAEHFVCPGGAWEKFVYSESLVPPAAAPENVLDVMSSRKGKRRNG